MRDLLVAAYVLSLSMILSVSATKKEDLERAAELAVERAAERVAERAVEKALEAGNSTTTTVTVREGYSNARKVAEEQAAPGSQTTRLSSSESAYPQDYSEEYTPFSAEVNATNRSVNYEEEDFNWTAETPYNGNFGLKESKSPNAQAGQTDPVQEKVEEDNYTDDVYVEDDIGPEDDAWKSFSNWDENFKKVKNRWSPSKNFWSGEDMSGNDSFFWDMDDAETKDPVKEEEAQGTDPVAKGSNVQGQVLWKDKDYPMEKDFFSWDMEVGKLPGEKHQLDKKETKDSDESRYTYKFPKQPFWKRKVTVQVNSQQGENNSRFDSWTDKRLPFVNSWKDAMLLKTNYSFPRDENWKKESIETHAFEDYEAKVDSPTVARRMTNYHEEVPVIKAKVKVPQLYHQNNYRNKKKSIPEKTLSKRIPETSTVHVEQDSYLPVDPKINKAKKKVTLPISDTLKYLYAASVAESTPVNIKPPPPVDMQTFQTAFQHLVNKSYPSRNSKFYPTQKPLPLIQNKYRTIYSMTLVPPV